MVQYIQNAPLSGRLGSGIGEGLAQQIPKEVDRYRLSSGLQQFEQDSGNLNPTQQMARLLAIPGMTPQGIQTFGELLKQQNQSRAYQGAVQTPGQASPRQESGRDFRGMEFSGGMRPSPAERPTGDVEEQKRMKPVKGDEATQPQIVNVNPLREEAFARHAWNPQQRNQAVSDYIQQGFLPDQAKQLAADDEQRYLAEPGVYQQQQEQLKNVKTEAHQALRDSIETVLQKKGEDVYGDITGEMLKNFDYGMERDLRLHSDMTVQDAAKKWSNIALNLAKDKQQLSTLAGKTGIMTFFRGASIREKLKTYQENFKKGGNSEEYFNILKKDFGMSPQGSALVAYDLSPNVAQYIDHKYKPALSPTQMKFAKPGTLKVSSPEVRAAEAAEALSDKITPDDSILAIAKSMRYKDPLFDQTSFFKTMRENMDRLGLSERQRREIAEGTSDLTDSWGDILVLPMWRRP